MLVGTLALELMCLKRGHVEKLRRDHDLATGIRVLDKHIARIACEVMSTCFQTSIVPNHGLVHFLGDVR